MVGNTYATWNPSDKGSQVTLSNGNLTFTAATGGPNGAVRATQSNAAGKWYWEVKPGTAATVHGVANASMSLATFVGRDANGLGYAEDGKIYKGNVAIATGGATFTTNDVIGVALDMDGGSVKFYKNNVLQYTISGANVPAGALFPASSGDGASGSNNATANFGASAQTYSPPAGYNAGVYI